jgi:hypothetical protein
MPLTLLVVVKTPGVVLYRGRKIIIKQSNHQLPISMQHRRRIYLFRKCMYVHVCTYITLRDTTTGCSHTPRPKAR